MATRYTFTQYLFGGGAFPPTLMDALVDPLLRSLGFTPSPAVAPRTWPVSRPRFIAANPTTGVSALYEVTIPAGVFAGSSGATTMELPQSTDAAEVDTITKVEKSFVGNLDTVPRASLCAAAAYASTARACTSGSPTNLLLRALGRALELPTSDDEARNTLATRYGFFARFQGAGGALVVPPAASGGGGTGILLAVALAFGYAYTQIRGSGMGGLGRATPSALRRRAQRYHRAGRHAKARRLEQRANRISRSM